MLLKRKRRGKKVTSVAEYFLGIVFHIKNKIKTMKQEECGFILSHDEFCEWCEQRVARSSAPSC